MILEDLGSCIAVLSALVVKLGGKATLNQADLDEVRDKILHETIDPRTLLLELRVEEGKASEHSLQ